MCVPLRFLQPVELGEALYAQQLWPLHSIAVSRPALQAENAQFNSQRNHLMPLKDRLVPPVAADLLRELKLLSSSGHLYL